MIEENLESILSELPSDVKLVAVSKFHSFEEILQAYQAGQLRFGENRPQEFASKAVQLPPDIEWHFIGHLQTNKLKLVLPYASMVQSVDSLHLLEAIESWCSINDRDVSALLEVHVAAEETKGGFSSDEAMEVCGMSAKGEFPHVKLCGIMGMASHTDDDERIRCDFVSLKSLFDSVRSSFPGLESFTELSMGMSGDWKIAVECGSTMVRIGSSIFGPRI